MTNEWLKCLISHVDRSFLATKTCFTTKHRITKMQSDNSRNLLSIVFLVLFITGKNCKLRHSHETVASRHFEIAAGQCARPVIGILTLPVPQGLFKGFRFAHAYLDASCVKFVESAGARVLPVLLEHTEDYYKKIFKFINGLVICGEGMLKEANSYIFAARTLYTLAGFANENNDYFPIWASGIGYELLINLISNNSDCLSNCTNVELESSLKLSENFTTSRLFKAMPEKLYTYLSTLSVSAGYHSICLNRDKYSEFGLEEYLHALGFKRTDQGTQIISAFEAFRYPYYGIQWQPEKNSYEWSLDKSFIPHCFEAIKVSQYFSDFFVQETRRNLHSFPESNQEMRNFLIYNFRTYHLRDTSLMMQVYFFKNTTSGK